MSRGVLVHSQFGTATRYHSSMNRRQGATRIGQQAPRYRFFLNPYQDVRFTRCPICQRPTRQRKLPLVIHVDPMNPLALNKTCRYCPHCDLLIAHQDELEAQLVEFFARQKPEAIGNDYLVLGTMDRATWQRGRKEVMTVQGMVQALHDFKEVLRFEPAGGWGPQ
jgi:hypothetical protein